MRLNDILKISLQSLRRNRVRTALSLLGIVIGVFAVTVILSMGVAVKAAVVGYVNDMVGQDLVSINPAVPGATKDNSMRALLMGGSPMSIEYRDLAALENPQNVPDALVVNGVATNQAYVRHGNTEYRSTLIGASPTYLSIQPIIKMGTGRFYTREEEKGLVPVVVLGNKVAAKLFPNEDAVGQKVLIRDLALTVIGVAAPAGSLFGMDIDSVVILPLQLMLKRVQGNDKIFEIHIRAVSQAAVPSMVADIQRTLRRQHNITDPAKDDFMLTTAKEMTDRLNTITDVITYFLGFLAAISLLVGGIGIMNIMLVSVTERIREVGLRKALGAKNRDIMVQFLAEAVALTTMGGLIGGLLGFLVTVVGVAAMRYFGLNVPYTVSLGAFFGAALVAAVTGIVFGLQPARKAAALEPVESLRYE